MKTRIFSVISAICLSLGAASTAAAQDLLDAVFGDHMVLQRGEPVSVWGEGSPGKAVTVSFNGEEKTATVDQDGSWALSFPAMEEGGPYALEARGGGRKRQSLKNILIGDVWLCSGQSNMEYPINRALNPGREIAGPHSETIRLFKIAQHSSAVPLSDFNSAPEWQEAAPDSIADFSAACYFFARDLQQTEDAPLGLIQSSWGGSQIEAWISAGSLEGIDGTAEPLSMLEQYASAPDGAAALFGDYWEEWWAAASPDNPAPWAEAHEGWKPVPGEMRDYKTYGDPDVASHHGMIWFEKSFSLTDAQAGQDAKISLGAMDEVDVAWVNGELVGSTFGWGTARTYDVPAAALKAGENIVTVNVLNTWAAGGMLGPNNEVALELADGTHIPLGEGWTYQKAPTDVGSPPRAPWESIGGMTGLHNAMIAPLDGLKVKGAYWYQGESNADRADQYETLLTALVADWRGFFDEPDLPVIVVQLPGFGALYEEAGASGWGRLRDAQRRVASRDENVGLVVAIDVGDRFDIHPPNKQAVGARAATIARSLAYGEEITAAPSPASATRKGREVTVACEKGADRKLGSADHPIAFELCAEGTCAFADAELDGSLVQLRAKAIRNPDSVRYCWGDAPVCNLYDASGTPVTPFEIAVEP